MIHCKSHVTNHKRHVHNYCIIMGKSRDKSHDASLESHDTLFKVV